ncbi:MAG: hypothetical protein MHMPM18_002897 [Marteilia pararefringens]
MEGFNNVRPASHVGSSLSPIETAILILIGAFIVIRIMRKLLDLITDKDSDTTNNSVDERPSSSSTEYPEQNENEGKIQFSNKTQHTRQLLTKYYS